MTENDAVVSKVIDGSRAFQEESRKILSKLENSKTRVITIEETYKELKGLDIKQEDMIREALRCVENGLFRAAHILAWSGFIDYLGKNLPDIKGGKLSIESLREQFSDYKIIDCARKDGMIGKNMEKSLKSLLVKRNECAHPSDFFPGLNETLGYVSEIITRLRMLSRN